MLSGPILLFFIRRMSAVTPGSTGPGRVALLVVLVVGWLAEDE